MPDAALPGAALARRLLSMLDLTELSDHCSEAAIASLCEKATGAQGAVAAICIWPQHVSLARSLLHDASVRIATVANFPAGGTDAGRAADDVEGALRDGADEIDLVLPWRAFLAGDAQDAREMVETIRDLVERPKRLKVILETGEYPDGASIQAASRLAIAAGADFLKTSTGKRPLSATPEAARAMLDVIREADRPVGLKPSGGIRTLEDAAGYLALAETVMGPGWATPDTFRIGASSLHDALLAAISGASGDGAATGEY